jgi:hypothetical protein
MVIPLRDRVAAWQWDSLELTQPHTAKIWRFTVQRTVGNNDVQISEIELFSSQTSVLAPVFEPIDPFLATPAAGAANIIPVLVIRFLPTKDGINLDVDQVPDFWYLNEMTLADMKTRINRLDKRIKFMLEEGSRYHGYKDPQAKPMAGYKVVQYITVYENTPPGQLDTYDKNGHPLFLPDYQNIFQRFNVPYYVNQLGVKHIWFWTGNLDSSFPIYNAETHKLENFRSNPESNMSSLHTGDISNSYRRPYDLPIYDSTYIVFGNNFRREQNEAVGHNFGHQFEQMLMHFDQLDNWQNDLFWQKFVGADEQDQSITGRCGWNHMPPNTTTNYDYLNMALVESDIEDWTPERTGKLKKVNADTWRNLQYPWPAGTYATDANERAISNWHIYWMQALPGATANIAYGPDNRIANWWHILLNWDEAYLTRYRLYEPRQPVPKVTGIRLIDATTNQPISRPLSDTHTLELDQLPDWLSFEVLTQGNVGSVYIEVIASDSRHTRTENIPPYAAFGDQNGNYAGRSLTPESIEFRVTAYSLPNRRGLEGETFTRYFRILETRSLALYWLVDAQRNQPVRQIKHGQALPLSEMPRQGAVSIMSPHIIPESVVIDWTWWNGSGRQIENEYPYASFGDNRGNFKGRPMQAGNYRIQIAFHSETNGRGQIQAKGSIAFSVFDDQKKRKTSFEFDEDLMAESGTEAPKLWIYPNPANDFVTLSYPAAPDAPFGIHIFNSAGKTVYRESGHGSIEVKVETAHWQTGLYFITIETRETTIQEKLLVH